MQDISRVLMTSMMSLLLQVTSAALFVATKSGFLPDIDLYGIHLTTDNVTTLHFNCTTSHKTLGCSVEFHVTDVTYDDIRFVDGKCVHNNGKCPSNICSCTDSCMIFTLNISSNLINSASKFSCEARIFVNNTKSTYSVQTAVEYKGGEFRSFEKVIIPLKVEQNSEISSEEADTNTPKNTVTYVVVAVLFFLLFACPCGIIFVCDKPRSGTEMNNPLERIELKEKKGHTLSTDSSVAMTRSSSPQYRTTQVAGREDSNISTISCSSTERSMSPLMTV